MLASKIGKETAFRPLEFGVAKQTDLMFQAQWGKKTWPNGNGDALR